MSSLFQKNVHDINMMCIDDYDSVTNHITHTHYINVDSVKNAVCKLKSAKSDCREGILSDNFKNGTTQLFTMISLLFSAMLTHGVAPEGLLLSTLVPIIKNKRGNKCDSNNYRQIAISSLMGKLLDIIISDLQSHSLYTDDLQFGFKKGASTAMCTSLLLDTIEYYNENDTDCYLLLLDASKAFDRVEYVKLFHTLRDRNICPTVLRLLMNMYVNQQIQVKWNSMLSEKCSITNGVKQGGCLSPTLFSVYLDKLIDILRQSNIGCRYGSHYMGVYCYADDLSLLSPTVTGIREMLHICEKFASRYNIMFNAKKSQLLCFNSVINKRPSKVEVQLENGQMIPYVDKCMHLGNEIGQSKKLMVDNAVKNLNVGLNNLLADFSHCDSSILSTLFRSYCLNVYGSQIWTYNDAYINTFYTCYRKAIRRIWNIPNRTHNNLVYLIDNTHPINVILEKRCIKYLWTLINSECHLYRQLTEYSTYNMTTTLGENKRYFMFKYNISQSDWNQPIHVLYHKIDMYCKIIITDVNRCTAAVIREMCESRDSCVPHLLNLSELKLMIDELCIA